MLCDFGLSKAMGDATSSLTTTKSNFTILYASPELWLCDQHLVSNDTWSWGCLLLHVSGEGTKPVLSLTQVLQTVSGILPHQAVATDIGVFAAHAQGQLPAHLDSLDVPTAVQELLIGCWRPANQRISMADCVPSRGLATHIQRA